jgi:hypothetical protein
MAQDIMSSRASFLSLVLALPLTCEAGQAHANPGKSVCPVRPHKQVTQIYLFDGRPEERFFLAPDDRGKGANQYTVRELYRRGSILTVRCEYGATDVVDIPLKKAVAVCTYSEVRKEPALHCR